MYNTREEVKARGEELEGKLKALCKEIEDFVYTDDVDSDNLEVIEEYGKWNRFFYNKIIKSME